MIMRLSPDIMANIGFWVILISSAIQLIKPIIKKDFKSCLNLVASTTAAMVILKIMPILFNWVRGLFM